MNQRLQPEPFDAWWERLVDLATDLRRENYLRDKQYHMADWYAGLTVGEVIEYRVGEVLQKTAQG